MTKTKTVFNPLVKPLPHIKQHYDYNECRDYLQQKYRYDERDYVGKFDKKNDKVNKVNDDVPYQDFWHWVLNHYQIHNGCYITFYEDKLEEIEEDWIKTIFSNYLKEFADDEGKLEMYCWW